MKVEVNKDACIGCGACMAIADEIFEMDDEGLSKVIKEKVTTDEEKEKAKEAMESCPTGAIITE